MKNYIIYLVISIGLAIMFPFEVGVICAICLIGSIGGSAWWINAINGHGKTITMMMGIFLPPLFTAIITILITEL